MILLNPPLTIMPSRPIFVYSKLQVCVVQGVEESLRTVTRCFLG